LVLNDSRSLTFCAAYFNDGTLLVRWPIAHFVESLYTQLPSAAVFVIHGVISLKVYFHSGSLKSR
jgi:hypothetical protein